MNLLAALLASLPLPSALTSPWSTYFSGPAQKPLNAAPAIIQAWNETVSTTFIPSAPRWVAYWDDWVNGETGPPATSAVKGFNVFILSFLLASGPADQVQQWVSMTSADRASAKAQYNAAGISLMVSAFGSTDAPTSSGFDAVALAKSMATFVKTYNLDGIDVDYEDFNAINAGNGKAEQWLITFTQTLRDQLPAGQYIITHAPVAPWFSPIYPAGAYRKVHSSVGSLIDWYNVQFYNQDEYTTCAGLLSTSTNVFPKSSVFEIASSAGVPLNKILIGKPASAGDAANGYMTTSLLASCVQQAKALGWNAGVMVWEYPRATSSWITAVRALSWPVGGSTTTTSKASTTTTKTTSKTSTTTKKTTTTSKASTTTKKTTTTSSKPTKTTTSSLPSTTCSPCQVTAPWTASFIYTQGAIVSYNGYIYNAQWWTQGDTPGGAGVTVWVRGYKC